MSDEEKLALAMSLNEVGCGQPYRATSIPKASGGTRELHIPTMRDRALQTLLKLSVEGEYEVTLDPHLYGARAGTGVYDALASVASYLHDGPKYVAIADIQDFFPSVPRHIAKQVLHLNPKHKRLLDGWLDAPTRRKGRFQYTHYGVPQGTAIAPLIAHATLQGLHEYALEPFSVEMRPLLVVYVDDVRVLAHSKIDEPLWVS